MQQTLILAAFMLAGSATLVMAQGDAAKGEKAFRKCMVCHSVGEGAKPKVGPVLTGVIGRTAGTMADFRYSKSMTEAGAAGMVWDAETLSAFIENPRTHLPGTKMAFAGIKKPEERDDIVAYLSTFSDGTAQEAEGEAATAPEVDG